MRGIALLAGIACLAIVASGFERGWQVPDLTGRWRICLTFDRSTRGPECGDADIGPVQTLDPGGNNLHYYLIAHQIPLDSIFNSELSRHGTIAARTDSTFMFWLGSPVGSLFGTDGGWLLGDVARAADSLIGDWHRTCFAGCPDSGTIVFHRLDK